MADVHERSGEVLVPAPEGSVEVAMAACQLAWLVTTQRWTMVEGARDAQKDASFGVEQIGALAMGQPGTFAIGGNIFISYNGDGDQLSRNYRAAVDSQAFTKWQEHRTYHEARWRYAQIEGLVDSLLQGSFITVVAHRGRPGFPPEDQPFSRAGPQTLTSAAYCGYDAGRRAMRLRAPDGSVRLVRAFRSSGSRRNGFQIIPVVDIVAIEYVAGKEPWLRAEA